MFKVYDNVTKKEYSHRFDFYEHAMSFGVWHCWEFTIYYENLNKASDDNCGTFRGSKKQIAMEGLIS